jgi:NADH dehydrogenase [ubiquinone] 1 alpha subcomplex assembly factor 5
MSGDIDDIRIFDRALLRRRRDRAAAGISAYDFLFREVAERLAERLEEVRRSFPLALDLGCHHGCLASALGSRGGIGRLVQSDLSPAYAVAARNATADSKARGAKILTPTLAADEEFLPFADGCFDLVLSSMVLHWANDLPGSLIQIRRALRPDGLFLGAMLGGATLGELRQALLQAEAEADAGASPRISPFAELRDAAALLQRASFALPVADIDRITVSYPDALSLMRDLRGMGESNVLRARRRKPLRRQTLLRAAEIYHQRHRRGDGKVVATFDVLFLTGWAPDASQPRPLRPGSAKTRLAEALGTEEHKTGEPP